MRAEEPIRGTAGPALAVVKVANCSGEYVSPVWEVSRPSNISPAPSLAPPPPPLVGEDADSEGDAVICAGVYITNWVC